MRLLLVPVVILAVFAFIALLVFLARILGDIAKRVNERRTRAAGRHGETAATGLIKSVLREGDRIFTNVEIVFEGRRAELDNVIVNRNGVFVIEVKNYNGKLVGNEEDYEWHKYKVSPSGKVYESTVKNPIRQVKRQVYLLAKYLKSSGCKAWVDGYVFFLRENGLGKNAFVLSTAEDIDKAIHKPVKNPLTEEQLNTVSCAVSDTRPVPHCS